MHHSGLFSPAATFILTVLLKVLDLFAKTLLTLLSVETSFWHLIKSGSVNAKVGDRNRFVVC